MEKQGPIQEPLDTNEIDEVIRRTRTRVLLDQLDALSYLEPSMETVTRQIREHYSDRLPSCDKETARECLRTLDQIRETLT